MYNRVLCLRQINVLKKTGITVGINGVDSMMNNSCLQKNLHFLNLVTSAYFTLHRSQLTVPTESQSIYIQRNYFTHQKL